MLIAKALVLGVWFFGLGNLIFIYPSYWSTMATWTLGSLAGIHIAETMYFLGQIKAAPEPIWQNLFSSMVFGLVHNRRYLNND